MRNKLILLFGLLCAFAINVEARTRFLMYSTDGATTVMANLSGTSTKALKGCAGGTVSVYISGTSTPATIYSTEAGTAKAYTWTLASNALIDFWANDGEYKLIQSGGGCTTRIWDNIVLGSGSISVPVTGLGAVCDGTTDDTVAIQAALDVVGPHRVDFPAGTCKTTDTLTISQDRIALQGLGKQSSVLNIVPTANGKIGLSLVGSAVLYQVSVKGLTIKSTDTTYAKTALQATDTSELLLEDIAIGPNFTGGTAISPFTGAGSVGIKLRGRELTTISRVDSSADIPLWLADNPNSTLDVDHLHVEDFYGIAAGTNPVIYVSSGVNLTNVTFDGYQAWVSGKYGLYWIDTTSTIPSFELSITGLRYEQPTARGWIIDIEHNQALYGFQLRNSYGGSVLTTDGVKLRKVRRVLFDSYSYNGTGVAFDVDSTVTEGFEGRNVSAEVGSTISTTGLSRVSATGPPLGGGYPTWHTFRYDPTAAGLIAAGYCFELMGLNKCGGSGTVASTDTVSLPSLGGVAGLLGRVTVVVSGATKHASCTVSYDAAQPQVEATSNASYCTIGNTAGAFCIHWSSASSIVLRNNLGESVKYWYEVTQIP